MIWARAEKRRIVTRPRIALMALYTTALCLLSLAAMAQAGNFRVSMEEAEAKLAEELTHVGMGSNLEVDIIGRRSRELMSYSEPVSFSVERLEPNESNQRFSATLVFSTEASLEKPAQHLGDIHVAGRFEELVEVPVLKYRIASDEIVKAADIEWITIGKSRTDRDTIYEEAKLIGKTPARTLSAGRPIRAAEVEEPPLVLRNMPVRMSYQTANIRIDGVGLAMEEGAYGNRVKVRNEDSGLEVDAIVTGKGTVKVQPLLPVQIQQQASLTDYNG